MRTTHLTFALFTACALNTGTVDQDSAIFTTTADGTAVDANIYGAKGDVYLDGGPGRNAPAHAAALDPGDYYFQVTDPSGKVLLSTDDIACRTFTVGDGGFITRVGGGACAHATGVDNDYGADGAITVQLAPFADTPNDGGEYKVWVIAVDRYDVDSKSAAFGFVHRYSKTDNFKVMVSSPPPEEGCGNGTVDAGETCDDGNTTSGDGCSATCQTEEQPPCCCGDGVINGGEQCDDGNTTSGDGCSSTCQTEEPPPPPPPCCCGDGVINGGETCDDGNTTSGDGCSATCQTETLP
jgi:cysteine-rich repeat protein